MSLYPSDDLDPDGRGMPGDMRYDYERTRQRREMESRILKRRKEKMEIKPEAVTAALDVLREHFSLGGYASVSDHVWTGQTPEERAVGIENLKAADKLAEQKVRIAVSDALRAAAKHM